MAEFINATDSLNEGRKKLNAIAKEMNDKDVSSTPEIVSARGGYGSLAQSINSKITKNTGSVTSADLSQEVKEQMTGGSVAVVGKNAILEENIVDQEVTMRKIRGSVQNKNMIIREDMNNGIYTDPATGSETASASYSTTDFISHEIGQNYSWTNARSINFYDENKDFVTGISVIIGSAPQTIEVEYPYSKTSIADDRFNNAQIEKGLPTYVVRPNRSLPLENLEDGIGMLDLLNNMQLAVLENFKLNIDEEFNSLKYHEILKQYTAIKSIKVIGVNPDLPVKIWILSREFFSTIPWGYRFILGVKENGEWSSLIDTGTGYNVDENEEGYTKINFSKNGITVKMEVDYSFIEYGSRLLEGRTIDTEPLFVINPKNVMLEEIPDEEGSGGYNHFDQSLNTSDDVTFNSLKTTGIIPTGTLTNPPAGLLVGDQWADTTDSEENPIVRVKLQ